MLLAAGNSKPPAASAMAQLVLGISVATILVALGFEHLGGYVPCPLCLQQRWAYYFAIPTTFLALILLSARHAKAAALLLFAVALAFLANAGLGVYHAGAEWKFWPGPDTCAGGANQVSQTAQDLLKNLSKTRVVRCDEPAWRFAGLSFAGWNVLISLLLFGLAVRSAFDSAETKDHPSN